MLFIQIAVTLSISNQNLWKISLIVYPHVKFKFSTTFDLGVNGDGHLCHSRRKCVVKIRHPRVIRYHCVEDLLVMLLYDQCKIYQSINI